MRGKRTVKPDPNLWHPLLEHYRLTSLPHDTVLEGRLRSYLDPASDYVTRVLASWPASAYLHDHADGTDVVLVYQVKDEPVRPPWVHVLLFLATLVTTLGSGALMAGLDPFRTEVALVGGVQIPYPTAVRWRTLLIGASFALPFLGVLSAHEMGHYLAARAHRVRVSLPYFIPFPPYFSVIGTIGAFIRLRGPIVRRRVLFDIGAAGPLAGFAVSLPLLGLGLLWSETVGGRADLTTPFVIRFFDQPVWLGNGLLVHAMGSLFGPGPVGEAPILLHPLALVGWLGLFVTALNLLPLGQLDGGHIVYALDPRSHPRAARTFLLALVPLGLLWWGWWVWGLVVLAVHRGRVRHASVVQGEPDIGRLRRALGLALIVMFFLTFAPVPVAL